MKQLRKIDTGALLQTGPDFLLWLTIILMPVNLMLEAKKWHILASSAQKMTYGQAMASYLAGIAFSMITPNRLGEYPGRLLYLKRKNTFRLISVSILGAMAQMLCLFLFGLLGLTYFYVAFPGVFGGIVLVVCALLAVVIFIAYWRFETWMPLLERMKWLRRFHVYGKLLKRFTRREQFIVLLISVLRYTIFTAQYLILLRWLHVYMPLAEGFCMCALFFWVIAVIPSIALVELGERGQVSLYLFHHFSDNTVGILAATVGIWSINLILPAIIGSILLLRMRWLR